MTEPGGSLALPGEPALAAWASAFTDAGDRAYLFDSSWRLCLLPKSWVQLSGLAMPIGRPIYSPEMMEFRRSTIRGSTVDLNFRRSQFLAVAPFVLATTPGGRLELRTRDRSRVRTPRRPTRTARFPAVPHTRTDFTSAGTASPDRTC